MAKDVAEWIEHSNLTEMVRSIDDDEKLNSTILSSGQNREMTFLTEDGLYEVLMQSRKPIAKEFKKQVKAILKQIRQTGGFIPVNEQDTEQEILARAMQIMNNTLEQQKIRLNRLEMQNLDLSVKTEMMQPKAEYFDELVDRQVNLGIRETAKEFGIKQKAFVKFLIDNKYLYRGKNSKLMPYAIHVTNGIFAIKECISKINKWGGTQTLITPKGRETFRLLCL